MAPASWSGRKTAKTCAGQNDRVALFRFQAGARQSAVSPCSSVIWPICRLTSPDATSARILLTLSGAARNSSRRCTSVIDLAIGCRFKTQSRPNPRRRKSEYPCRGRLPFCVPHNAHLCRRRYCCSKASMPGTGGFWVETAPAGGDDNNFAGKNLIFVGRNLPVPSAFFSRPVTMRLK